MTEIIKADEGALLLLRPAVEGLRLGTGHLGLESAKPDNAGFPAQPSRIGDAFPVVARQFAVRSHRHRIAQRGTADKLARAVVVDDLSGAADWILRSLNE